KESKTGPEFYLNLPDEEHEVLIAISLDHPRFDESIAALPGFERSRQSVGVIDIGSNSPTTKLLGIPSQPQGIQHLKELCQGFCDDLYEDWKNHSHHGLLP